MTKEYILRDEEALPLMDVLDNAGIPLMPGSVEVQQLWQGYMDGLTEVIEGCVPDCQVVVHGLTDLAEAKQELVIDKSAPTITLDSYDIDGNFVLGASRHFAPDGKLLGIGKRPGFPDLSQQLDAVAAHVDGREIVVFDDDVFSGQTALEVMAQLEAHGIKVGQFIAGLQVARSVVDSRIMAVHQYDPADTLELNDPRDFLFGSHQGGLVVNCGGKLSRVPYIAPFVEVEARASIPEANAKKFTSAVAGLNQKMFTALGYFAGKPILASHGSPAFYEFVKSLYGAETAASTTMLGFVEAVKKRNSI